MGKKRSLQPPVPDLVKIEVKDEIGKVDFLRSIVSIVILLYFVSFRICMLKQKSLQTATFSWQETDLEAL